MSGRGCCVSEAVEGVRVCACLRKYTQENGGRHSYLSFHQSKFHKGDFGAVFVSEIWEDIARRGSSSYKVMR